MTLPTGSWVSPRCLYLCIWIDNRPLALPAGTGQGAREWSGSYQCWVVGWSLVLAGTTAWEGFSAAEGKWDMFCMRLGVFGVVVSVGDAIALFCLGVRPKGRLDVLSF